MEVTPFPDPTRMISSYSCRDLIKISLLIIEESFFLKKLYVIPLYILLTGENIQFFFTKKMFDVPLSNIFLLLHKAISELETFILERYFNITLYLRFLNSGLILLYLINFKLNFSLGLILFLKDIEITLSFTATLNK